MKCVRAVAVALGLFAVGASAAQSQSLATGTLPAARAGFGLIIIVSSIGEGLFVLKKRDTTTVFQHCISG